jgi:kynurenine formamidase
VNRVQAGKSTKLTLLVAFALSCGYLFELKTVAAEPPSKVVDLSHILGPNLPDFHVGNTTYEYKQLFSIAKDGYADGQFTTPEHYGTHMDAPSHFYQNGQTIDQLPANKLILPVSLLMYAKKLKPIMTTVLP